MFFSKMPRYKEGEGWKVGKNRKRCTASNEGTSNIISVDGSMDQNGFKVIMTRNLVKKALEELVGDV